MRLFVLYNFCVCVWWLETSNGQFVISRLYFLFCPMQGIIASGIAECCKWIVIVTFYY